MSGARRSSPPRADRISIRPSSRPTRRVPCSTPSTCAGRRRRIGEELVVAGLDLTPRDAEQRIKRVQRGAEREELLAQLDEIAAWYRDLVVVGERRRERDDPRRPPRRPPGRCRARPRRVRPSGRPHSSASRGGRRRSSTSTRPSGSTRSSCNCGSRSPELTAAPGPTTVRTLRQLTERPGTLRSMVESPQP